MRIAILNNCVPHLRGGAEYLAEALRDKLRAAGHQALLIRVPFRWKSAVEVLESLLSCRLLRLPNVDRVIALKFPAYCVEHPRKIVWLLHQFRQVYDLWDTSFHEFGVSGDALALRDAIRNADNRGLSVADRIYTNSRTTRDRLMRFNGIPSEVLYPPLVRTDHLGCREYGDFLFYPSRMNRTKRQLLVVRAMVHTETPVRLVLAGPPDTSSDLEELRWEVARLGLSSRVVVIGRFISEQEKADLLSRALACVYVPYDEDSYGFVSLEAYHARKAVLTCSDSGGVLELVRQDETGLVVPPEPAALASAMDRLFIDRRLARNLGEAGWSLVESLGINWDRVITALTE